jgi:hypothetical protein
VTEKNQIELETARAFLRLYNAAMQATYRIVECSDAPDVGCEDENGRKLAIEITLTEEAPGEIRERLGRSPRPQHSMERLREQLDRVRGGDLDILQILTSTPETRLAQIVGAIRKKLVKRYGDNVALVVRDTSPCDWDWELEVDAIRRQLAGKTNAFSCGIWVLSAGKDRIVRVA